MVDNENIKDVEFEEVGKEKIIRGSALYYSTNQVATILGESDSKIRYYSNVFEDILNIEISNKQRRYKQEDIDKLKFIIELKNEGMTLKQIKEYCQEVDFNNGEIAVKESNPLSIKVLAQALMDEQTKQIELMKADILESLKQFMIEQKIANDESIAKIREEVCITVDDVVSEKLNENMDKLNNDIAEIKESIKFAVISKEDIEKANNKKSWFSKIFK